MKQIIIRAFIYSWVGFKVLLIMCAPLFIIMISLLWIDDGMSGEQIWSKEYAWRAISAILTGIFLFICYLIYLTDLVDNVDEGRFGDV